MTKRNNVFAATLLGAEYPGYISVNAVDGLPGLEITVRTHNNPYSVGVIHIEDISIAELNAKLSQYLEKTSN